MPRLRHPAPHHRPLLPLLSLSVLVAACGRRAPTDPRAGATANGATVASGQSGGGNTLPQAPPVPPVDYEREWRHPMTLADDISFDDNDADSGALGAAQNGDAMLAWEWGSRIYGSERRGGVWRHPIRGVSQPFNPAGGTMFDIAIALDPRGDTVMVWAQRYNGFDRVYMSHYHSGTWTNPTGHTDHISPAAGGSASHCTVATAANGDAVVVWEQYSGPTSPSRIYKSELIAGVWTHPQGTADAISVLSAHAQDAQLAIGPNGHVIVVWSQADAHHYRIFKSEKRNGVWTHPASLADNISPAGTNAYLPAVAFDGAGNAVIAWVQGDGAAQQVFKAEYRGGNWTYPTGLTDNISPDATTAHRVAVAMGGNGDAVIVWRQDTTGGAVRLFKSERRGTAWVHPASLNDHFGVGPQVSEFSLGVDSRGNTVIAYTANDGVQPFAMYLSEFRYGGWQHATTLGERISPVGPDTSLPRVAIDGRDEVVVLWRQSNGNHEHAYISEFR